MSQGIPGSLWKTASASEGKSSTQQYIWNTLTPRYAHEISLPQDKMGFNIYSFSQSLSYSTSNHWAPTMTSPKQEVVHSLKLYAIVWPIMHFSEERVYSSIQPLKLVLNPNQMSKGPWYKDSPGVWVICSGRQYWTSVLYGCSPVSAD